MQRYFLIIQSLLPHSKYDCLKTLTMSKLRNIYLEVYKGKLKASLGTVPIFLGSGIFICALETTLPAKGVCSHLVTLRQPLRCCRSPHPKAEAVTAASALWGGKSHSMKGIGPSQSLEHCNFKLFLYQIIEKIYSTSACNKMQ